MAKLLQEFLLKFQTKAPVTPFLGLSLKDLLLTIMGRFLKKEVLEKANTFKNLSAIDHSCLSDSDNEYLPPSKRSLCPSDSSSDKESNGSDGQPFTSAPVENEVMANSEVNVKSGVHGPSNRTASRRIIWRSIVANANAILLPSWKVPCQSLQI